MLSNYNVRFPHRDGADLIENNLVTREGAQKKSLPFLGSKTVYLKSLIMAQIERWR